jgi:hypothetical protein
MPLPAPVIRAMGLVLSGFIAGLPFDGATHRVYFRIINFQSIQTVFNSIL